ncbi:TM2 domain-containing protein [Spongiivirga citrea]|uniref:NINE protein n=1 Tax=Spongiivirga citrea TaxID=1481457 RepID=A0A6M0CWD6_9FLAO|nr:TM2 domain-containing protein [Spongiivirga citrea]NER18050.1 NINE protein [Spongiivirga citrea]
MSDDNKSLGDDLNDMIGDAKEGAKKAADKVKEETKEFAAEAKETASEFKEGLDSVTGSENKKILAGILAIVLGSFGVHKFILGYNKEGIILLAINLIGIATSCLGIGVFISMAAGIIGLIEGIMYLTKSDEEFYNTYQAGKKPWF